MKEQLRNSMAIAASKLTNIAINKLNLGSGTSLPGYIARRISPNILSLLIKQTKKEILLVTGTNGKTTTAGFIANILKEDNRKVIHNKKGANMLTGITTEITKSSSIDAQIDVDNCLFEIDEAYFLKAVDEFNPDAVLVTNLFRDQLDRYGELDTTAKKIQAAIEKTSKTKPLKIILNADDPMVSSIAENNPRTFYGFDEIILLNHDKNVKTPQEICACKNCGEKFEYTQIFYGHLGHYKCSCGKTRPNTSFYAKAEVDIETSKILITLSNGESFDVTINMPGLYNAYNALAAIAMALELGISTENIKKGFQHYDTVFGRAEAIELKKKQVLIQLIKNPIGATEVLRTVKTDPNSKLLIIINDDYADGRDVSWLWDANFELLKEHNKKIITSGIRAGDMAVRLKYAGIEAKNIEIIEDIKKALDSSLNSVENNEKLYILPTYTALLNLQKIIKKY